MREMPFYSVGYIGSLGTAYRERADIARELGMTLYLIETTQDSLELLESKGQVRVRYWTGSSMEDNIIIQPPRVFYDKSNATFRNVRQQLVRLLKKMVHYLLATLVCEKISATSLRNTHS
jgi:tRNA (Thr-GGU) A37 N-methylase